jgi:hypothetical protein
VIASLDHDLISVGVTSKNSRTHFHLVQKDPLENLKTSANKQRLIDIGNECELALDLSENQLLVSRSISTTIRLAMCEFSRSIPVKLARTKTYSGKDFHTVNNNNTRVSETRQHVLVIGDTVSGS